jgi:HD-GYP domain-containing protein (c-di-GMP phosphodiesterase class II)
MARLAAVGQHRGMTEERQSGRVRRSSTSGRTHSAAAASQRELLIRQYMRGYMEKPESCGELGLRGAAVAAVFGDLADLKTPYTHGHSRGVAALTRGAGERLGFSSSDLDDVELAGFLHDVGRVAISDTVWDKPDRLSAHEWEQVRLHAYHSERILAGSEELARLAPVVGAHHERCDGSGYHRGCTAPDLSLAARVLAAAALFAMEHDLLTTTR